MAKTQEGNKEPKGAKSKGEKESKDQKGKNEALMKRVKKVVKKSRRKLSEEKFEKELQRTMDFLEELQNRINHTQGSEPEKVAEPSPLADKPADKKAKTPDDKTRRSAKPNAKSKGKSKRGAKAEAKTATGAQAGPAIASE